VEVNGMKIVLGIYIGWENRVTIDQKHDTIGFCNGQKFEEPPKLCHDWVKTWRDPPFSKMFCSEIESRFGQRDTICKAESNSNLTQKKIWVQNFVSRFQYR